MGEQGNAAAAWDVARLAESEKMFWVDLWGAPCADTLYECGADQVRFGPVRAACLTREPGNVGLNFVLGAGEANAVGHGHLADAVDWLESRCMSWDGFAVDFGDQGVDYRVPVVPGLPESRQAERWLSATGHTSARGAVKLVRDTSAVRQAPSAGIEVLDWEEWDEGFGEPLAESLGLPRSAAIFFLCLLDHADWRCYCAVRGDDPLAYVAMRSHAGVASIALASRPYEGQGGDGQLAVLQRCVADAAAEGCDTVAVADAGVEPPTIDRQSLLRAGFEPAYRVPSWRSPARVAA